MRNDPARPAPLWRLLPLLLPALALLAWCWLSRSGRVAPYILPSPADTLSALRDYVFGGVDSYAGRFGGDLAASLGRVAFGFGVAVLPGVALGLFSGRAPLLARLLSPLVNGIRAVPGISWLPLALLWLGIGFRTTVFLIALAAFFPAYLNALAGAASVPADLIRAGRMLGFSRAGVFLRVILPSAMPQILAGLRISLGLSFAYLVLGEMTGVPDGLGAMIMDARMVGRVDMILVGIAVIALTGWVCDRLLGALLTCFSKGLRRP